MKTFLKLFKYIFKVFIITITAFGICPTLNISLHAHAQTPQIITEFILEGSDLGLKDMVQGSDGNVWFTEFNAGKIGRITPNGTITEFPLPETDSHPWGITLGADGNIWFTERNFTTFANNIGKITPDGVITEFAIASGSSSWPYYITTGSDGTLWFTQLVSNTIKRINYDGTLAGFYSLAPGSLPIAITSGVGNNVWFASEYSPKIGRISSNGIINTFDIPTMSGKPSSITSGSDGNMWFTEGGIYSGGGENIIGRITPEGVVTEFYVPAGGDVPVDIITGSDGNLWFIGAYNTVGRITPEGNISLFTVPTSTPLTSITSGSDGNIWFTEGGMGTNKIGRLNISNVPPPPDGSADYKQTDPQWSTLPTQPVNSSTRLNHSLNCGDMYGYGCAVTSVANVFFSYGKTLLPDNITQLQPGHLNDWLTNNKGFSSCSIIWANASGATQLGAPAIMFRNNNPDWIAGQQAIDNALSQNNLPIVGVYTSFGTHFITLSDKLPDVNGKPDYKIIDPALYPFVSGSPGKTGQSLSQAYGGWDKVFETVIYKKNSNPQKTLTIRAHSPVQLFVTDPFGSITGYDESIQEIVENIPDSSYGIEPGIAPVDGSSSVMEETKYFQQINPTDGEYILQVVGTGQGTYTLDFSKTDEQGKVSTGEIYGVIQAGTIETYNIQYTADASSPPIFNKEVTFESTLDDVNELYNLGNITQKSIANNLIHNLEQAQTALIAGDNAKVQQNLDQFLTIMDRNRGGKIAERAYQVLLSDANVLKSI